MPSWNGEQTVPQSRRTGGHWSPLHYAVDSERIITHGALLNVEGAGRFAPLHGKLVNVEDVGRFTPLLLALANKYWDLARVLPERGANASMPSSNGWTPLHFVAKYGNVALVVELLVDNHGATVDATESLLQLTPLLIAAENQLWDVVSALLDRGADFRSATRQGWTPPHFAVRAGIMAVTAQLVDRGADPLRAMD